MEVCVHMTEEKDYYKTDYSQNIFFTWTWNLAWVCYQHIYSTYQQQIPWHTNTQNITLQKTGKLFIATNFLFYPYFVSSQFLYCTDVSYRPPYYMDSNYSRNHNHPYVQYKFIFSSEKKCMVSEIKIKYMNTFNTWWHSSCTMTMVTSSRYKIEEMLGSSSILCSTKTLSPQFSIAAYGCLGTANRSRNRKNVC